MDFTGDRSVQIVALGLGFIVIATFVVAIYSLVLYRERYEKINAQETVESLKIINIFFIIIICLFTQ